MGLPFGKYQKPLSAISRRPYWLENYRQKLSCLRNQSHQKEILNQVNHVGAKLGSQSLQKKKSLRKVDFLERV